MFEKLLTKIAENIGERHDIIPASLALKAMRSSGFKSTDTAVAELIDNSIQSGIQTGNECTNVEVLCIEEAKIPAARSTTRITKIAVYDDAAGMDSRTLRYALMFGVGTNLSEEYQKGIGKFGMGLPNASISQCRHVDVYSWQNDQVIKTYLNVDDIIEGRLIEVPEPVKAQIPEEWKKLIKSKISDSGTLVIWSQLDRPTWVRHRGFFNNAEFLIGRIYRYFIISGRAQVRLAAFSKSGGTNMETLADTYVRANDPLMLMTDTMAPAPYDNSPAFEDLKPEKLTIRKPDGSESVVSIKYSIAKQETRDTETGDAGSKYIGKFVAKNLGVSIVRAGRELELNTSWNNPSDPRERWWGIEINFGPDMDDIFGVTNNKQSANNLYRCDIAEDSRNAGISKAELIENLSEAMDPRLINYNISLAIAKRISDIRKHIELQMKGKRTTNRGASKEDDAETIASKATQRRMEKTGKKSKGDLHHDTSSPDEKTEVIKEHLLESGVEPENADIIAVQSVSRDIRYYFTHAHLTSGAIFDIEEARGEFFIKLNMSHPAYEHFIELLSDKDSENDSPALKGLKLLLTAWARLEDETFGPELRKLQDLRIDWGRIATDFIHEATGEIEE